MTPLPLTDKTRTLAKPADMTEDECSSLDIHDLETSQGNFMISAWQPSEDEIDAIISGQPIFMWIRGVSHPAVNLTV